MFLKDNDFPYITALEIEHVKCFKEKQVLRFADAENRPYQWTVLLGDNGTGKTTVLRSLMAYLENIAQITDKLKITDNSIFITHFNYQKNIFGIGFFGNSGNPCFGLMSSEELKNQELFIARTYNIRDLKKRVEYTKSELISLKSEAIALKIEAEPTVNVDHLRNTILSLLEKSSQLVDKTKQENIELLNYESLYENLFKASSKLGDTRKFWSGDDNIKKGSKVIAYGANRIGEKNTQRANTNNTSTLIDDDAKLIDVERYFLDSDYLRKSAKTQKSEQEFETIKEILLNVLPDVTDIRITIVGRNHEVEFQTPYGWVKYQDMSLGYQTITAWILDLAIRMFEKYPNHKKPLEQPAVVLVDEIDLHMHPQWQQKIIGYLSERFPKTQFIVTAHSPLIVQSATDANVIVLKRKGNQVIVENTPLDVANWRIDQILSSDLFGLSARNLEIQKKIDRRKILTLKEKLTTKEQKELDLLDKEVEALPTAESPEMIRAMELIHEAAKQLKK